MSTLKQEPKWRFIINCVYFALIVAIAYLVIKYMLTWFMPFIIAFLMAAVLQPAVRFCHKKTGINRKVCGIMAVLLFVIIMVLIAVFGVSKLISELSDVAQSLPGIATQLSKALTSISASLSEILKDLPKNAGLNIDTSLENISAQILKISALPDKMGAFINSVVVSMPGLLLDTVVTVVAACFISADYPSITGFIIRQLPLKRRETAIELKSFFLTTLAKLLRAYLTLMFITFCELCLGLTLLRVPHAVIISAAVALVDIMPVLGTGTVMVPWAIMECIMGRGYSGLGIALVYAVITIVRNILEPKIVGHHIGLHPLVTLAAIVIGLKALGFAGMIFFPITIIVLKHMRESGIIKLWKD